MLVKDLIKEKRIQYGLTMKELADKVGVSEATVSRWESGELANMKRTAIMKLAQSLHISPYELLGLEPVSGKNMVSIPILGHVIAGEPMDAEENIIDYIAITPALAATGTFFALQVQGDSMLPKLHEGDTVIVRRQPDVESGDIAIVLVNGNEATVKQVKKSPAGITLIGYNVDVYPPHFYSNEEIESLPVVVLGKVVELRRSI